MDVSELKQRAYAAASKLWDEITREREQLRKRARVVVGPGRNTVYTAWKRLQAHTNKYTPASLLRAGGDWQGSIYGSEYHRHQVAAAGARVDARQKDIALARAFRWLKNHNGRGFVEAEGRDKGAKRIAASRRPPAHITEAIRQNWTVFAE